MSANKLILGILVVLAIVVGAYWIFGDENSGDAIVEPAAAAREDLAQRLSMDEADIEITQVEERTWSDSCLGLGGPAESCLQALTPGFRVELVAQGGTYFYRTDQTGASVRIEPD